MSSARLRTGISDSDRTGILLAHLVAVVTTGILAGMHVQGWLDEGPAQSTRACFRKMKQNTPAK